MADTLVLVIVVVGVGAVGVVTGVTTGDAMIGDGATGDMTGEVAGEVTGTWTGALSTIGAKEGVDVTRYVGALVGTNTRGACTTAAGMETARLVEMALTYVSQLLK